MEQSLPMVQRKENDVGETADSSEEERPKDEAIRPKDESTPDIQRRQAWPEDDQNLWWLHRVYLRWSYSYLNVLLAKGAKQYKDGERLEHSDLFDVPSYMKSAKLSSQFREMFDSNTGNLVPTLWKLIKPIYVPAGFCQLITVLCQSTNPLVVRGLLNILEDNPSQSVVREGLPFAIGLFFLLFINGTSNHKYRHLAMKSGVLMRTALVNVIYEHVLHLTPRGRAGLTSGEVSTLVAVDTQKVFEAAQEGHLVWSLPLSILLVTTILLIVMGPVTLVGIGVLILFLPVGTFVTTKMHVIRKKRVKKTDERIELVSSMLQGIKIAKLNNYEDNYNDKITEVRNKELRLLSQELAVWAVTLTITVLSPLLATAATFATYVLVDENNILTASKTFTTLLLFTALRFPINYAARFLGKAAQALSALARIQHFLRRDARYVADEEEDPISTESKEYDDETRLILETASFQQGPAMTKGADDETSNLALSQSTFRVEEFNLAIKKGEVVAVVGPVASGKSTLIGGIIHEVEPLSHEQRVVLNGNVAYVPQTPFIINTTLRENILFGLPFDRERYEKVLDACCLRADIEQLGAAQDLTEIGERGVTLSGGQKQRVACARAAYAKADIVLLDDPLSALDAGTAKFVFEKLIKGRNALFSSSAVVLVTHASHFLNLVDNILIIVDGRNRFYGTWDELTHFSPADDHTFKAVDHIRSSVQEGVEKDEMREDEDGTDGEQSDSTGKKMHRIMTVEEREYGLSSLKTWLLWFKHAGGGWFLSILVILLAVDRFLYVATEYWTARWTDGADRSISVWGVTFPPQTDGLSAQYEYLRVFGTVVALSFLATNLRSEWAVTGGSRAAKKVHKAMLDAVLKAPLSYFETTPLGRVLNRFSYDIEIVDMTLTEAMSIFMISISWFCAGLAVLSSILPWMLLALFPVVVIYMVVLLHYRKSGVDLQRLDAMSRSPVQAMVSEVFDGSSTIRVFQRQQIFTERFRNAVDINSSAQLNMISAQRWLGVRIENLGAVVALVAGVLVVFLNDVLKLEPGMVGLLLIWSSYFSITLGFLLDFFGETEAAITAIERVDAMAGITSEKAMESEPGLLAPEWPQSGELVFDNVCLRYRSGLPLALSNLTFTVPAGKRCGVVGRTGAGKSSLTVALFRLVEIESGRILLDGVELGKLGLADVRGRSNGMSIIPQDPFLTGSTLRECIDPFNESADSEVMEALQAVRMAKPEDPIGYLSKRVEEGGSNFSVGERQLLNLARALLSKPKVLVLDEATASVDGATDAFIQQMLRTRFAHTTQLTIAHRLHTVMDNDLILTMADGEAAEIGSPAELLQRKSRFAELVDATGPESAKALRAMVEGSSSRH